MWEQVELVIQKDPPLVTNPSEFMGPTFLQLYFAWLNVPFLSFFARLVFPPTLLSIRPTIYLSDRLSVCLYPTSPPPFPLLFLPYFPVLLQSLLSPISPFFPSFLSSLPHYRFSPLPSPLPPARFPCSPHNRPRALRVRHACLYVNLCELWFRGPCEEGYKVYTSYFRRRRCKSVRREILQNEADEAIKLVKLTHLLLSVFCLQSNDYDMVITITEKKNSSLSGTGSPSSPYGDVLRL